MFLVFSILDIISDYTLKGILNLTTFTLEMDNRSEATPTLNYQEISHIPSESTVALPTLETAGCI